MHSRRHRLRPRTVQMHIWRRQVQQTDWATVRWRSLFYAITRNVILNYYRKITVYEPLNYAVQKYDALWQHLFKSSRKDSQITVAPMWRCNVNVDLDYNWLFYRRLLIKQH